MGIASGTKPSAGDALKSEHAAVPSGAIEGELYAVDATTAPAAAEGIAGSIPAGTYKYKYTFAMIDPISNAVLAETKASTASGSVVLASSKKIDLTGVLTSVNFHVNARRLYRSLNGGSYELLDIVTDNTTTSYLDNTATTSGQPVEPSANTTGQAITINLPAGTSSALKLQEAGVTKLQLNSVGRPTQGPLSAIYDRSVSAATANSSTETTLYTYTIPAGDLGATGGVKLSMGGTLKKDDAGTMTLRVKLGGTEILNTGAHTLYSSQNTQAWNLNLLMLNAGSATSQRWVADFNSVNSASTFRMVNQGVSHTHSISANTTGVTGGATGSYADHGHSIGSGLTAADGVATVASQATSHQHFMFGIGPAVPWVTPAFNRVLETINGLSALLTDDTSSPVPYSQNTANETAHTHQVPLPSHTHGLGPSLATASGQHNHTVDNHSHSTPGLGTTSTGEGPSARAVGRASSSVDTASAVALTVTWQWSATSSNLTATKDLALLEKIPPA
jgi:hypothetical protein